MVRQVTWNFYSPSDAASVKVWPEMSLTVITPLPPSSSGRGRCGGWMCFSVSTVVLSLIVEGLLTRPSHKQSDMSSIGAMHLLADAPSLAS